MFSMLCSLSSLSQHCKEAVPRARGCCSPGKGSGVVDELQSKALIPWLEAQPTAGVWTSCCHRWVWGPKQPGTGDVALGFSSPCPRPKLDEANTCALHPEEPFSCLFIGNPAMEEVDLPTRSIELKILSCDMSIGC